MDNTAYEVNAANVLVLRDAEAKAAVGLPDSITTTGRRMLELVQQVMSAIKVREEKAEAIAAKALEQLKVMREHNRALEVRVTHAEAQARAAELLVRRLHAELENQLSALEADVFVQPLGETAKAA